MYSVVLTLHVIVVVALVLLILVQRGRSSGLVEALGGVESIFGTKTSSFFVKVTVVLAVLFFTTSITLAYLSKQRSKSLLEGVKFLPESSEELEKTSNNITPDTKSPSGERQNFPQTSEADAEREK